MNEIPVIDERYFNGIVQSHYDTLIRTAIRITNHQQSAEDIVQETFLRLWQNRDKVLNYNTGGWLYTVTKHLAYKHIKKAKRDNLYIQLHTCRENWHTDVEDHLLRKENQVTFDAAYMQLPQKQQAVYRLSREQGLSRQEIASQLSISPNTVKNHLFKAIQSMKEHIQTVGLMSALFVFYQLFFLSNSTKQPLRDLYFKEDKRNTNSEIEEVYKQIQNGYYTKNNESLSQIQ